MFHRNRRSVSLIGSVLGLGIVLAAVPVGRAEDADTLAEALEKATKEALAKAAPYTVRIDTVGGLEVIRPGVRKGEGSSTGVIVSEDGYIISSSFNFAHLPKDKAGVFVRIPGRDEPLKATIIATDETRFLTLIKVDAKGLPVPEVAEKAKVKIGQWSLALGRSWTDTDNPLPSVSVGVISATDRIWGKAFQTDCKVSPVNYGGPLINMEGKVIGIIVPMSPTANNETAGYEWYDGGIGFAIPMQDVMTRSLASLKEGKNLKQGVLGITLQNPQDFAAPVVGNITPGSPAANATAAGGEKLQTGDKILKIGDEQNPPKDMNTVAQVKHRLFSKYEGEKVTIIVERGGKQLEFANIVLAGSSPARAAAFLGILPMRDDDQEGVEIRYVFEKSPAAEGKLAAGDRILKVDGQAVANRDALAQKLSTLNVGQAVKLQVKRKDGKEEEVQVKLGDYAAAESAAVPSELPKGSLEKAKAEAKEVKTGMFTVKTDEATGHEYWAYVPENYDPKKSYTLLVWLHPAGSDMERLIARIWTGKEEEVCKKHDIILLAPKATRELEWITSDVEAVKADIRDITKNYHIDRQRIVVHGQGLGASLGMYLAFDARDMVRGVAAVGGVMRNDPKPVVANQRLSFFLTAGTKDPNFEAVKNNRTKLSAYPVIYHELAEHGNGYFDARHLDVFKQLVRWIDSIDRL